jgi:hypothetical protein
MSVEDHIDGFVGHFRRQIAYVASLTGDESIAVNSSDPETRAAIHKKILYSAILDSLAGIRYRGQRLGNEQRILAMLEEHTSWDEGRLVSVPVLTERLKTASPLRDRALEILSRYSTDRGNSLPLTAFDKPHDELERLAASRDERELLEKSKHFRLFYRYRTFIVHEFREPGYAMEVFADGGEEPAYHSYIGPDAKWRLLYPEGFFRARAENALASLDIYFRDNRINPYDRVKDSGDWFA